MMGFFAFYCGWIYNDFLGMNLNIFGSCYTPDKNSLVNDMYLRPEPDCIYPIGIDPIWGVSLNELVFVNNLKMKIAVIIAIIHMCVGVFMKLLNAIYFKRILEIVFEFIPQILFLGLLFGYMDFLIVFKWLKDWECQIVDIGTKIDAGIACLPNHAPPSIISTMMDIGLAVGSTVLYHPFRRNQEPCGAKLVGLVRTPYRSSSSSLPSSASRPCSSPSLASRSTN